MKQDLCSMDNAALKELYNRKLKELSDTLLNGAEWSDVQDERHLLTEIAKQMNKRGGSTNPAEYANRS